MTNQLLLFSQPIFIAALVVLGIIVLIMLIASSINCYVKLVYRFNRRKISDLEVSPKDLVQAMLNNSGAVDVEVKEGWFPRFKKKQNCIVVSKLSKRASLVNYAIAMQMGTQAILHNKGDKNIPNYNVSDGISIFSALSLIGAGFSFIGIFTTRELAWIIPCFLLVIAGFILYTITFVISIKNIGRQKHVNKECEILMENLALFNDEEHSKIKKINKAFTLKRVIDGLLSFFYAIYYLLLIIGTILKLFGGKKK